MQKEAAQIGARKPRAQETGGACQCVRAQEALQQVSAQTVVLQMLVQLHQHVHVQIHELERRARASRPVRAGGRSAQAAAELSRSGAGAEQEEQAGTHRKGERRQQHSDALQKRLVARRAYAAPRGTSTPLEERTKAGGARGAHGQD